MDTEAAATESVERVLEELRPYLRADGGDVSVVAVDRARGVVKLRLRGACGSCPSATATVQGGIRIRLEEALPWVREVVVC